MQPEHKLSFIDRLRIMRETRFGAFVPVLLALAAIWAYFGLAVPLWEYWGDADAESIRFIFLSPRNIYNLFMQSAVIATLAVGITVVLLLGDIDLSAAATAGVCAALLGVLVLAGVPSPIACLIVMAVGIIMGTAQGLLVAYIGIPSFVVTLAGLLGFQGLMQKILPTGNLNVGDPFIRGFARVLLPDALGWALAITCIVSLCMAQFAQANTAQGTRVRTGQQHRCLGSDRILWRINVGNRCHIECLSICAIADCSVDGDHSSRGLGDDLDPLRTINLLGWWQS